MPRTRPQKPYADYPLFAHATGQWAKKIKGQTHYFGVWANPQAALEKYLNERDHRHTGRKPPSDSATLAELLNAFHRSKQIALEEGNLTPRSLNEYLAVCDTIAATLNKHRPIETLDSEDFARLRAVLGKGKSGKKISATSHKRLLSIARMVFHFANEELDPPLSRPVRYEKALRMPAAKTIRKAQNAIGERLFTPDEIRALIDAAAYPHGSRNGVLWQA